MAPSFHKVRTCLTALVVVASLLVVPACTPTDAPEQTASVEETTPPTPAPPQKMNVLVVVLDALRADLTSLHGHDRPTTPHLEKWAERGTIFKRAYSQATITYTSVWSFMTGQYPYLSSIIHPIRKQDTPLAELMKSAGYATASFSDNPYVNEKMFYHRGFDTFVNLSHLDATVPWPEDRTRDWENTAFLDAIMVNYPRTRDSSEQATTEATDWILNSGDAPWFCYLHILRPHNPYYVDEPFLSRFVDTDAATRPDSTAYRDLHIREFFTLINPGENVTPDQIELAINLYEASIAYGDHLANELLAQLDAAGKLENTIVVITSDHGETFFEHGKFLHGLTLPYQDQVHVPLVVILPESMGDTVPESDIPVGLIDLVPTLRDAVGLEVSHHLDGQSLLPTLRGQADSFRPYTFYQNLKPASVGVMFNEHTMITEVTANYQEIIGRHAFNLTVDPGEQQDIFNPNDDFSTLMQLSDEYIATRRNSQSLSQIEVEFSDEEIERLESLGYLQGESSEPKKSKTPDSPSSK